MNILHNIGNCHQLKLQIWLARLQDFSANKNLTEKTLSEDFFFTCAQQTLWNRTLAWTCTFLK